VPGEWMSVVAISVRLGVRLPGPFDAPAFPIGYRGRLVVREALTVPGAMLAWALSIVGRQFAKSQVAAVVCSPTHTLPFSVELPANSLR